MFLKLFLTFFFITYSTCETGIDPKIINGELASIESAPFFASLRKGVEHICGASIIAKKFALTAAICVSSDQSNPSLFKLRTGTSRRNQNGTDTPIDSFYLHPTFRSDVLTGNIAIIKLKKALKFDLKTQAVKLPRDGFDLATGSEVFVVGLGLTGNQLEDKERLRAMAVKTISMEDCVKALEGKRVVYDSNICTDPVDGKSTCRGDAGNPMESLADNGTLVGIACFADQTCKNVKTPSVFTKIANFLTWIRETTKIRNL